MKNVTIDDISYDQYKLAENIVIDTIRAAYPNLDLRIGTVIRHTTVQPTALIYAVLAETINRLKQSQSLIELKNSDNFDSDDVNKLLSNFNLSLNAGGFAKGIIKVSVYSENTYVINEGVEFSTIDNLRYKVEKTFIVQSNISGADNEIQLIKGPGDSYYFLLPVIAVEPGNKYNIEKGVSLSTSSQIYELISIESYSKFSGGYDGETIDDVIQRIPVELSHRGFTHRYSVEALIRKEFKDSIYAVNVCGYGDAEQIRDRHNIFNVSIGGKADVYVRTFFEPNIIVLKKTGTRLNSGEYAFIISEDEVPGFYSIESIVDSDKVSLASYRFSETRQAVIPEQTWHDIDKNNSIVESAYSSYQSAVVIVKDVPDTAREHEFRVDVCCAPKIKEIQNYLDQESIRPVSVDLLIRSPLICFVSCVIKVYRDESKFIDVELVKQRLSNYINSRNFVEKLTRSELAHIVLNHGANYVALDDKNFQLVGRVRDANGTWHILRGDEINIDEIYNPRYLLSSKTCVFATSPKNIHIIDVVE